jgi:hypothetical protein
MGAHPPPPGRLSGICHFGKKMSQMPHHGVQIMQQNPHPWGPTLTQMPHSWGQNISFLRIFEQKNRTQALSRINISVFKIEFRLLRYLKKNENRYRKKNTDITDIFSRLYFA